MAMELIKLSVMYITFFLVRETFQNRIAGCPDGYYRNETNGTCSICLPGYVGRNCSDPCARGFYGKECQHQCPSSCSICNIIDGSCPEDMTITTDTGNVTCNASIHIIQSRNKSAFYVVTTLGCATVVALLLVLMFYIYKLATQPLPQNFTFMVQDPESEAERNIVNPACDSIYENI